MTWEDTRRRVRGAARRALTAACGLALRPANLALRGLLALNRSPAGGTSIPRFYWEEYLAANAALIRGFGLELDTDETLRRHGGDRLLGTEVLDLWPSPKATWVADLADGWSLPAERFDTFLLQFTLHVVERDRDALYHALRVLRPGGTLLCNFPSASGYPPQGLQYGSSRVHVERWYTPHGVRRLLQELVPPEAARLEVFGNSLAVTSYLNGVPAEVVGRRALLRSDPGSPLLVCAAVTRPERWSPAHAPRPGPGA